MIFVDNRTPLAAELFTLLDNQGQEVRLLVVATTFVRNSGGSLELVLPQPPVCTADEYNGKPELSSLRREADIALVKPLVDVIVNGFAYAPQGSRATSVAVELHVADIHKRLIVRGNRRRGLFALADGRPEAFDKLPIVYERAYGGTDARNKNERKHNVYRRNPVGVGYRRVPSSDPTLCTCRPNTFHHASSSRLARSSPAGMGIIGRSWSPRIELAGTYDASWIANQWPLLPLDFDVRHYQAAPPDQQSASIVGGEEVRLVHLTPDGEWRFRLPRLVTPVQLIYADRVANASPRLDTVLIDAEAGHVSLSHRIAIPVERDKPPLREIVLGTVTRGWLTAKAKRKRYLDWPRSAGSIAVTAMFR